MFDDTVLNCSVRIILKLGASIAICIFGMKMLDMSQYSKLEIFFGVFVILGLIYFVLTLVVGFFLFWYKSGITTFVEEYTIGDTVYGHVAWNITPIAILVAVIIAYIKVIKPKYLTFAAEHGITTEQTEYLLGAVGGVFLLIDVIRLIRAVRS